MTHADNLIAMGGAFLAAGLLARLGGRIGLPTIPLFMMAGILLGPHTPGYALVEDPHSLEMLSALGLVLLLFYLGLEFHFDDLKRGGGRMIAAGGIYLALNIGAGLAFGFAVGWGTREALVLAGVIGISSSAIVTKLLVDLGRIGNPETRLVLGIIVIEDIFLALYLAALSPVLGSADSLAGAALDFATAFAFLLALAAAARWGTRIAERLVAVRDSELLVVTFLGLAVLVSGIAEELGVSDAIGAFMVGMILGATTSGPRIRELVHPLRDAFAAIFFFAFGVSIDPGDVLTVMPQVLVAVAVTFVSVGVAGVCAGALYGYDRAKTANVTLAVLSRGEFALVLGTLAAAAGLDARLTAFIAGYVLLLAMIGPLAAARPGPLARVLPRRFLPDAPEVPEAPEALEAPSEAGETPRAPDAHARTAGRAVAVEEATGTPDEPAGTAGEPASAAGGSRQVSALREQD
ncbi:cation:proton antiporter [Allostreptomyces psammosilenae]|uniref:CPA2 family monovalent cation:H+ antiporter-2 n=1 Tax=Allostreptomyces psammosilenae TaxID=1892865 RepID=A0A853A1N8_9ACTN|nr:cation:proton antiporter [Allostreptomyces psammosilenae]NYI08289.1 CPA2 family monovalent cation:H+ antiporter-2 [Allostreptomyces psammosilenae]